MKIHVRLRYVFSFREKVSGFSVQVSGLAIPDTWHLTPEHWHLTIELNNQQTWFTPTSEQFPLKMSGSVFFALIKATSMPLPVRKWIRPIRISTTLWIYRLFSDNLFIPSPVPAA